MAITLIADVHGKYDKYLKLTEKHPYTVQIGDFGFNYDVLKGINAEYHRMFFGNHDNYDLMESVIDSDHCLGDFGIRELNGVKFFFIRGAWSIDGEWRRKNIYRLGKTWWEEEELLTKQLEIAINEYTVAKPDIVLSHECPLEIVQYVTNPQFTREFGYSGIIKTRTNQALQACLDIHRPSLLVFGHYHKNWNSVINGTEFRCLNELETLTI